MKSILIMSSERSGSNLVREMLNAHSNISAPPAAQLPRFLTASRPYYHDLTIDANMKKMIADAIAVNKTHPEQINIKASVDEIIALLPERSVWGLISTLYMLNAKESGKTAWASKDNFLFNYAYSIIRTLPDARFVYLFRDGRDYASSMRKVGKPRLHIYSIAKQWQAEQQACIDVFYSLTSRVYLLRYEDLLIEPESTLRKLCNFLDEPFENKMLSFHDGRSAKNLATQSAYWENLSKPVMKNNFAKFRKELSHRQIALFESVAGSELALLGYPRMTDVPVREPILLFRIWYALQNEIAKYLRLRRLTKKEPWRKPRNAVMKGILADLKSNIVSSPVIKPLEYQ